MYARRFLWVIAICIMLVIAAAVTYRLFGEQLIRIALVPSAPFSAPGAATRPDYAKLASWSAHPGLKADPARWAPAGVSANPAVSIAPKAAVFFILGTTAFDRSKWNVGLDDPKVNERTDIFLRLQASSFNSVGAIWSPRYRQATFGSFLTDKPQAAQAIDAAYADVLAAFDAFVAAQPADRPLILAGHSQGSLHLLRLLKERVAGTPLAGRIIAVYAAGWPVSLTADLPALGIPACTAAAQTGCLLSWQSFAEPADYALVRESFDRGQGLTGAPRAGTAILCTNPLAGVMTSAALPAARNLGSLVPEAGLKSGHVVAPGVPARCTAEGITSIGEPPLEFTAYILPGNNFHVYDYPLFWANIRADAERRAAAFAAPAE